MPRRFYLETLGCKLNQTDTGALARELLARGMEPARRPEEADLLVVNTCTVTGRADADGRKALRRLHRANPRARLVAMGCYARRDPATLADLPGVSLVAGGSGPEPVVAEALRAFPGDLTVAAEPYHAAPFVGGRTRATLKIQDGCNLACSYCIIPSVRGRSRSVPAEQVADSLSRLVATGFSEVVLTGVNTGDWGRDLDPPSSLEALLTRLLALPGLGRLRLNSLEPRTVTPGIVALLAGGDSSCGAGLAPHLQVPLQSGSDRILAAMRRNYRRRDYMAVLERLAHRAPDIGLGADVIVGFPGESEADFEATESLVRDSPLAYLHVFSYSARPGTDAAGLGDPVDAAVIKERAARLRELAAAKGSAFRKRFVGRRLAAVVLSDRGPGGGHRALTGNFFEVELAGPEPAVGGLVPVRIEQVEGLRVLGRAVA